MSVKYLIFLCLIIFNYASAVDSRIQSKESLKNVTSNLSVCLTTLFSNPMYMDAWAKYPSGVLVGNIADLGNFNECINIDPFNSTTKGSYCLGTMIINFSTKQMEKSLELIKSTNLKQAVVPSLSVSWGGCFPNICTEDEINNLHDIAANQITFTFQNDCQTYDEVYRPLTTGAKVAIGFFSAIFGLMVVQTAYELLCVFYMKKDSLHPLLTAFSVYTNGTKLFKISKTNDMISCLNGMRFISMAWVIYGHQFQTFLSASVYNIYDVMKFSDETRSMAIVAGTMAVDTFFTISGILMVYGFLRARSKGNKLGPFQICVYYIHRFIRLTPALGATMVLNATLYRYLGNGPFWPNVIRIMEDGCNKYWWTTLLYVQNYVNPENFCVGQSWYLSVDMQLFYISPILFLLLEKWPKPTFVLIGGLSFATMAVSFDLSLRYHFSAINTNYNNLAASEDYMEKYYVATHTRAAPWLIGIVIGYIIFHFQKKGPQFKMNKLTVLIGWTLCWITLLGCALGGHSTLRGVEYDKLGNAFHIALVRPFWALGLGWLIVACQFGYGGPVNWILSLPIYAMLNRFTYSMYLLHVGVIYYTVYSRKFPGYWSEFNMDYLFWSSFMLTFIASGVWVLAFESPMVAIEKLIFGNGGKKNKTEK